ncbi:uncharacterized protein [Apostichopus japonicus]|uniref:uncharacterized protein n=1 Tax=Stichopus japonicus TaxID=307972 RepID=UPI003AB23D29
MVCSYEEHGHSIECTIRLPLDTKDDTDVWLKNFQDASFSTWRVSNNYPHCGKKNTYRVDLHCQHNTCPRSLTADQRKGSKNTKCPSKFYIVVKKRPCADVRGRQRSKDVHITSHPTVVNLKWNHNHEITSADTFRKRDVSDATREKLLELFSAGHSPSSAIDTLKYDLQMENNDEDYLRLSADKATCPDLQYCFR